MNILNNLFSDAFIFSFGWTLIHSLWHGAVISLITLLILYFMRNQRSSVRYNFTVLSMLIIVLLSIWTFISFYGHYSSLVSSGNSSLSGTSDQGMFNLYDILWFNLLPGILKANLIYFTEHLPLFIVLWFIAVLFLSIKYTGAYIYSQRLKHNRIKPAKAYWIDKLAFFSSKMNLKKRIQLLESALVKVPVVIGYFKPVIIVPLGLFSGIPQQQIEAILIHELAHIKRNDYLVKLLQTIVEILFFFNPFIWWISSIINKEREHCCDDLAISITKDNISFVRALAGLCELEAGGTSAALAFGKSNNQIIKRMERVMNKNENKNNLSHFTIALVILISSLVALGTTTIASSELDNPNSSIQDSTKIKHAVYKKDSEEMKMKAEMIKIQESMTKLKTALKEEKDPDTRKKYKEKLMILEKKAKAVKEKHGGVKKVKNEKEWKNDNEKQIDELKKKLSMTKDKDIQKKIKMKIKQLEKEAELTPPPPPPPPKN